MPRTIYVCSKAELHALVDRLAVDGEVEWDAHSQGLPRLNWHNKVERTPFDAIDERYQSGRWPPDGRWPTEEEHPEADEATNPPPLPDAAPKPKIPTGPRSTAQKAAQKKATTAAARKRTAKTA